MGTNSFSGALSPLPFLSPFQRTALGQGMGIKLGEASIKARVEVARKRVGNIEAGFWHGAKADLAIERSSL